MIVLHGPTKWRLRPLNAQICVSPEGDVSFGSASGMSVSIVDNQGHMLSVDHVGGLSHVPLLSGYGEPTTLS